MLHVQATACYCMQRLVLVTVACSIVPTQPRVGLTCTCILSHTPSQALVCDWPALPVCADSPQGCVWRTCACSLPLEAAPGFSASLSAGVCVGVCDRALHAGSQCVKLLRPDRLTETHDMCVSGATHSCSYHPIGDSMCSRQQWLGFTPFV